jgi:hypothetical protein
VYFVDASSGLSAATPPLGLSAVVGVTSLLVLGGSRWRRDAGFVGNSSFTEVSVKS